MFSSTDQLACEHNSPGQVTVSILKGILILSRLIYSCTVIHKVFFTSVKLACGSSFKKIHSFGVGRPIYELIMGPSKIFELVPDISLGEPGLV